MDPFGHARKKARSDAFLNENGGRFNPQDSTMFGDGNRFKSGGLTFGSLPEKESLPTGLGSKSKACTKFFSTSGCPYGEGCHFQHHVQGGVNPVTQIPSLGSALGAASKKPVGVLPAEPTLNASNYKTRLCSNYNTGEGCRFGDKCHFAHGEKELAKVNAPAHNLKDDWATGPFGSRFPVGGLDGKPVGRPGYREATPPGMAAAATFGASATAKISVDAALAGPIIGKGGINSKHISRATGAKLAIRDHESDTNLKNIELEGSFDQIKEASAMVRQLIMHTSAVLPAAKQPSFTTNNFKTKLCENYAQGTCTFGDRCHFAHGASELRDNSK
uniref:C3H1-type domain-containing protein n=1 Tax=Picea sitchensis TaxID=3332 RepID=B8LNK8_PICSI|nr:unknown [Picea sitchensis]